MGYTEKFTDHPLPRHMSVTHKFQPAAFYESKKKFFLCNTILSDKLLCPKRGLFLLLASSLRY